MPATQEMRRTWTEVGAEHVERLGLRSVEHAVEEMEWKEIPRDGSSLTVGFMPGESIKTAIRELRLPKVSAIAINSFERPGFYPGFYGVECHFKDGMARVYLLDLGGIVTPLLSDFFPTEKEGHTP